MAYQTTWDTTRSDADGIANSIVDEIKTNFKYAEDWEAEARVRFDFDYKFANGDSHNNYQWDDDIFKNRELEERPRLTINKTQQHNFQIINESKQNKPGIRIRPVGDEATYEAAQIYQELIYHIEYISNAENVYDSATVFQVEAGWAYWRVVTDYINENTFDQEIYIRRVKDPRSVYLDPDINEYDGSDARWGIIFEDVPKKLFDIKYPKFKDKIGPDNITGSANSGWITKDHIRVAEYYKKIERDDKLVTFTSPNTGEQIISRFSELDDMSKSLIKQLEANKEARQLYQYKKRNIVINDIKWFKVAGDTVIEEGEWLGKYIPIVRLIGTETVIDGVLDRKGHTRALINAQQMYNVNTSANAEFGALQTKSPWIAPMDAIDGFETYWDTANAQNHSYLPYNHTDELGNPIPMPVRPAPPQASPGYVQAMQIAQNEMMMSSGQYQSQLGENENAKSGVAINARQRQGDRATYHFIDGQAIAVRFTGKIVLDLIPKIYDTKRVRRITTVDRKILNVTIDPNAQQPYQKLPDDPNQAEMDKDQKVTNIIFNPNVGMYDVQSDTGPSFATRRMEAFAALTQVAAQNKDFMNIGGDIYFDVADFPEADVLAQRWQKVIPPHILGNAPDPQTEQAMHMASDKIEQLIGLVTKQTQDIADKNKELDIKAQELDLKFKEASATQARLDYEAETKRIVALGNAGPGFSLEQIQPVIKQVLMGMLEAGEPGSSHGVHMPGPHEGGTPVVPPDIGEGGETPVEGQEAEQPPMPGAKKANGKWYVEQNGQHYEVQPNAG